MMLFFRVLLLWMMGALAFLQTTRAQTNTNTTDPRLALVASSPFRMILRPTPVALDFAAVAVVEDSISSTLLLFQDGKNYIDVEVVVQQVELVQLESDTDTALSSTRLRFFCLVTVLAEYSSESSGVAWSTDQRSNLDALIQEAFNDSSGGKRKFQELLQSSQDLTVQDISDVVVAPILPASTSTTGTKSAKKLSIWEIILIATCLSIFVGILYMIIQHHRDRGYIENQRIRTFNAPVHYHTDDNSKRRLMVSEIPSDSNKGYTNTNGSITEETRDQAPSTPSTTNSVDMEFNVNSETPDRIRITTISAMTQDALVSASSVDGSTVQTLSETFESKWFNPKVDTSSLDAIDLSSSSGISNSSSSGISSSSSEDVFLVGVNVTASRSDNSSGQDDQSKASTVSAVSEWLKTICVVPSDTKTSVMTHSSLGHSSAGTHTQPPLTMSLEQRSLEQSLASSSIGTDSEMREGVEPLEKMEV
jgi:uncharacterized protein with PQ loop repeat